MFKVKALNLFAGETAGTKPRVNGADGNTYGVNCFW